MSKAGIQSNRGDGYQTLVAFDWALTVLDDPNFLWLEVDSVTSPVDDVVVGKTDGVRICCQCKKNQSEHRAWSIGDLKDELDKAISLLEKDPSAEIRFYSRSLFGDLGALKELSTNFPDQGTYETHLGKLKGDVQRNADNALKIRLTENYSNLSTYLFLNHTRFEVSPDLDRMKSLLFERLRRLVNSPTAAFDAIWTCLDNLGQRESFGGLSAVPRHRLTKDDLKSQLEKAGSILTPPKDIGEIRSSFSSTSAIGRDWRRDICNERISNPAVAELIKAIEAKHGSILLIGAPGSGKTCVMLDVQDELERIAKTRVNLVPLFIQSREFADLTTAQDRHAQGLPEQWVERAARMADDSHVVIMIDSLDVLSIAREHAVLTYFLAQIDRLLHIPNITVVTACREFDYRYDLRIARRKWDKTIVCQHLEWDTEILPLLTKLGIDTLTVDAVTRELISNSRELSLFVELAQSGGSFNAVTSQALAQRYLDLVVRANPVLGDFAAQAIEVLAADMLIRRSLAIPQERFNASPYIKQTLLSNNVLHEVQNTHLTFGHQTLLDVLVVSNAIRQNKTLNEFIGSLPPVPFVRPSIRSFVAQLAIGDRRELRRQLRTVLTGDNAFHIRRLVAETFAEQIPSDEDWSLIRDLRNQHHETFQVIYLRAKKSEWHHFWMKYLVPLLREVRDFDGLIRHAHRIAQWKNDDANGVIAFWIDVLEIDQAANQLSGSIIHHIKNIQKEHLALCTPLLVRMLKFPKLERGFLGFAIARSVKSGYVDDVMFWEYIAGEILSEDVIFGRIAEKLNCRPSEFGDGNQTLLADRMRETTALLDLAIDSIESWSEIKISHSGMAPPSNWTGLLYKTSYRKSHSEGNLLHRGSEHVLMDAVQGAIAKHANDQSLWWQNNRQRLCFSKDACLRYFAILACTAAPTFNLNVIGRMLSDKSFLESDFSFELSTLMKSAFFYLGSSEQDKIQAEVLDLYDGVLQSCKWPLQARFILAIPCHLRSTDAQAVLKRSANLVWPLVFEPELYSTGGWVGAPFSFEIFLNLSDDSTLQLLDHYSGHKRDPIDGLLVGGEDEVGRQLREAASRCPSRFANFLSVNWERINGRFRDELMDGIAAYLGYRYGDLQRNQSWAPNEEPDSNELALQIITELEEHSSYWRHNRSACKAIVSCAHVVANTQVAARLVSLAEIFSDLEEDSSVGGDSVDLITIGINMARGNAADALVVLANELTENSVPWPESLPHTLHLFAADEHPAIRALILRRLYFLESHLPQLGWELFDVATQSNVPGIWEAAESCLYYAYHNRFESVAPRLARLYHEGSGKDLETWGRISALSVLSAHIPNSSLLQDLDVLSSVDAWRGAASVWTHIDNLNRHSALCFTGLQAGLNAEGLFAIATAREFIKLFREASSTALVPIELIQRCFSLLEADDEGRSNIFGFDKWLNTISMRDPVYALEVAEIYLLFVGRTSISLYDHDQNLTQLLTRLFSYAEELEESDNGDVLTRVIALQDSLLILGVRGVDEWLKASERP